MHRYAVFGGRLRSTLAFPELRAAPDDGRPDDWSLTVAAPHASPHDSPHDSPHASPRDSSTAEPVGSHRYAGEVLVRLLRTGHGLRIETSDIGSFDLAAGGAIAWRPTPGAREDLARFDVLGRVIPIALHQAGALVLHGSSVAWDGAGAVAFLAPKGHGKSTLALALAQRGARLLSDDATVIAPGADGRPVARPGVHAVRLWEDSAERLAVRRYGDPGSLGRKVVVPAVPVELLATADAPLRAVYLLTGRAPDGDAPAQRAPVAARDAAVQLVRQTSAGGLLGGVEAARVLERAAAVVRAVPVYALDHVRDYARLDEVADAVAAWHREGSVAAEPMRSAIA